jgi:ribonuclease HI
VDQTYRIFTDGSAIGNPGPCGWGVVVIQGKGTLGDVGRPSLDDYPEMELMAAVHASCRPLPFFISHHAAPRMQRA